MEAGFQGEMTEFFLDVTKVFDRICHKGVVHNFTEFFQATTFLISSALQDLQYETMDFRARMYDTLSQTSVVLGPLLSSMFANVRESGVRLLQFVDSTMTFMADNWKVAVNASK